MRYRHISTATAILFLTLCATLILLPELIYWLFRLPGNDLGNFLAKRAGMLFLGLGILCLSSRNTKSAEVESLVSLSVGVAMGAMALLGVYELAQGNAGPGILVAVVGELFIATAFGQLWFRNRTAEPRQLAASGQEK